MPYRELAAVRKIAVVGSGLIGAGWVACLLARGFKVSVHDLDPEAEARVRAHVAQGWPALVELGQVSPDADPEAVSFHGDLAQALDGADLVQENGPERREIKQALFRAIDAIVPADVLIASSSSSLPISQLQALCRHPERCVLGHPFNPVHLMPLVEVGGGDATDPQAIEVATSFYAGIGKKPVRLHKEIFGHIANRLTSAMFREAVSLVANGYASVRDVDDAIRYGPALKWAVQGQFATFHTSGGEGGLANFLEHFSAGIMQRWETMSDPPLSDPELRALLIRQVAQATGNRPVAEIADIQDNLVLRLLKALG